MTKIMICEQHRKSEKEVVCDFLAKVNDNFLDVDNLTLLEVVKESFSRRYLKLLKVHLSGSNILYARLSMNSRKFDFLEKFYNDRLFKIKWNDEIILHTHRVETDKDVFDENTFIIIKCNAERWRAIFKAYWFARNEERVEFFGVNEKDVLILKKFIRNEHIMEGHCELPSIGMFVFDNQRNGFHSRLRKRIV